MRNFFCASALALALASVPSVLNAQDTGATATTTGEVSASQDSIATGMSWTASAEQQATVSGWPADRQTTYRAWDPTLQEYFWSLTPNQQKGWWALTEEQRGQVYAMTPEQRAQAWTSIEAQLAGQAPSATPATPATPAQPNPGMGEAASPATPATPAQPATNMHGHGAMKGSRGMSGTDMAPPADANKKYPLCSKTLKDNCRNRGGV